MQLNGQAVADYDRCVAQLNIGEQCVLTVRNTTSNTVDDWTVTLPVQTTIPTTVATQMQALVRADQAAYCKPPVEKPKKR